MLQGWLELGRTWTGSLLWNWCVDGMEARKECNLLGVRNKFRISIQLVGYSRVAKCEIGFLTPCPTW